VWQFVSIHSLKNITIYTASFDELAAAVAQQPLRNSRGI
jgi:hypothetical protein